MIINNPAFDYDSFGHDYSKHRKADPRIEKYVVHALNDCRSIINVGAGAGSYEPTHGYVVAIEPSAVMREQRLKSKKNPAINASASHLPFDDHSFDAAMAMVTIHHWPDIAAGLKELKRVSRKKVIILTFDPDALHVFWNAQYFPELIAVEQARYPKINTITELLGGKCEVIPIPIPLNCTDGFQEAFYGRPEAFLSEHVRNAQSAWSFLQAEIIKQSVKRLENDLLSGAWDKKFGHYRTQATFTGALRLIIAT
jgi:SAM-dependent methyltransferase